MNNKHQKTLKAIFTNPVPSDIDWEDIESLFNALGAVVREGEGSRVRVALKGVRAVFHEPHSQNKTCKCAVKDVRDLLSRAGIRPKD